MRLTIIGSGISGLTSAFFAARRDLKTTLVSFTKILGDYGGLTKSIRDREYTFDIGPQFVWLSQSAYSILEIAILLGLKDKRNQ